MSEKTLGLAADPALRALLAVVFGAMFLGRL
jgi:hypothetical protein